MRRDAKYVVFDSLDEAIRFNELYDSRGFIENFGDYYYDNFYKKYFGEKIKGKVLVVARFTKEEFDEVIRVLNLKKKKWNGHLIYSYGA